MNPLDNPGIPTPTKRSQLRERIQQVNWKLRGKVADVVGTVIEAHLPGIRLGTLVEIRIPQTSEHVLAEVVGFRDDRVLLLPFSNMTGIAPGSTISRHSIVDKILVGEHLLGHVVDPFMNIIDEMTPPPATEHPLSQHIPIDRPAPNPMLRQRITKPLGMGVKAIDALLTMGDGQRMGIMAGSGVGKSVLMGMIARGSDADVNVIALIGERGREVREFIEKDLGPEGLKRSIIVAVTSDQSPLMKIRGAKAATAIAEYFSAQGKSVLLMMDSLTRVAMAQREIGLAIGEPPTTKGYTPSVFSLLPRLLERTGPQPKNQGNISALYTVLVDGDDFNDPIADAARSILDGQINLTRQLASKGHFPAIDIPTSISRVMHDIVDKHHAELALRTKQLIGIYQENIELIQIGAYESGTNPELDTALQLMPAIERFLRQSIDERFTLLDAIARLETIILGNHLSGADHGTAA